MRLVKPLTRRSLRSFNGAARSHARKFKQRNGPTATGKEASMEPRALTRGNELIPTRAKSIYRASMEPRALTRGNMRRLRFRLELTQSFNGAARSHAPKSCDAPPPPNVIASLSWSRVLSRAEIRRPSPPSDSSLIASMEPRALTRGNQDLGRRAVQVMYRFHGAPRSHARK